MSAIPRIFLPRSGMSGSAGAAAVEMALIAPLLTLLLIALCDLGFGAFYSMQVAAAATTGARYAAAATQWNAAQVGAVVTGAVGTGGITATPAPSEFCGCSTGGSLATANCTAACTDGSKPSLYATVYAQMQYRTILHYPLVPQPMTLSGRAIVRLQ